MTRQTFNKVCRVLKPDISPMENTVQDAIDVQKQVALTIYWLATPTEYRTIGNLFGVAKSTALNTVYIRAYAEQTVTERTDVYRSTRFFAPKMFSVLLK